MADAPPLPAGFTLDQSGAAPPLPEGFTMDKPLSWTQQMDKDHPLLQAIDVGGNRAVQNVAGLPSTIINAIHGVTRKGVKALTGADVDDPALGGVTLPGVVPKVGGTPEDIAAAQKKQGLPTELQDPNNPAQRYVAAITSGTLSALPGGVGAIPAGVLSSVAPEVAKGQGMSPTAQTAASVLGALAPGGAKMGLKKLLGVGETAPANAAVAAAAGAQPTVGMVAGPGSNAQAAESALGGTVGGAPVMAQAVQAANTAAGNRVEGIATSLNQGQSDAQVGKKVQNALSGTPNDGSPNYIQRIRATVNSAFKARDAAVPPDATVDIKPFLDRVHQLSQEDPAFESYIKGDPVFQRIAKNLTDANSSGGEGLVPLPGGKFGRTDPKTGITTMVNETPAAPGTRIPYADAAIAQSGLNQLVDHGYLVASPTSKINGSLSQAAQSIAGDVSTTLKAYPDAKGLDTGAKALWRYGQDQKDLIHPVVNAATGEEAMGALLSGSRKGATKLDATMRGLNPQQQNLVAGSAIDKLGTAVPSAQDAVGGQWSANTFLTNWNKLHPDAKTSLFRNMPDSYRTNLQQIADYAAQQKASAALYANPSGTANKAAMMAQLGGAATGLATAAGYSAQGHHAMAAATAGASVLALVGPYATAKFMTNPGVVRWIAASTKLPVSSMPIVINQLQQIGEKQKDPDILSFVERLTAASKSPPQQPGQ